MSSPKSPLLNGLRILVVDDDETVRHVLGRSLTVAGCQVSVASDGHTALTRMAVENFALVITDLKMPGMDGLELTTEIKKYHHSIPVFLITGERGWIGAKEAKAHGAEALIIKPFKNTELVRVLETAVVRRRDSAGRP